MTIHASVRRSFGATVLLAVTVAGCAGTPAERDAISRISGEIDEGRSTRLEFVSFTKTDGRSGEMLGIKVYEMMFQAEYRFASDAMFFEGIPFLTKEGIMTSEYRIPPRGSLQEMLSQQRPALKGDRLLLTGTLGFERRESGWVSTSLRYRTTHDTSTREPR
jgi:hypothetical protein